jgi:hypothetical protein
MIEDLDARLEEIRDNAIVSLVTAPPGFIPGAWIRSAIDRLREQDPTQEITDDYHGGW